MSVCEAEQGVGDAQGSFETVLGTGVALVDGKKAAAAAAAAAAVVVVLVVVVEQERRRETRRGGFLVTL